MGIIFLLPAIVGVVAPLVALWLALRFVRAQERAAVAQERLARAAEALATNQVMRAPDTRW